MATATRRAPTPDSGNYSKRVMGEEMLALMTAARPPSGSRSSATIAARASPIAWRSIIPEAVTQARHSRYPADRGVLGPRRPHVRGEHLPLGLPGARRRLARAADRQGAGILPGLSDAAVGRRVWRARSRGAGGISPLLRQAREHRGQLRRLPRRLHHRRRAGPRRPARPAGRSAVRSWCFPATSIFTTGENQAVDIWKRWATDVRGSVDLERALRGGGKAAGSPGGAGAVLAAMSA